MYIPEFYVGLILGVVVGMASIVVLALILSKRGK